MRTLMLMVALAACSDDGRNEPRPTDAEIHAHAAECSGWGSPSFCEVPCAMRVSGRDSITQPLPGTGACTGIYDGARRWECSESAAFEYKGVLGCCAHHDAGAGDVFFAVCEGE